MFRDVVSRVRVGFRARLVWFRASEQEETRVDNIMFGDCGEDYGGVVSIGRKGGDLSR